MRVAKASDGFRALAVAGTNVVLIGWDMPEAGIRDANGLGFAIGRQRASDAEVRWMTGMKTFESVEPAPAPGVPVSSFHFPFQTFQWADYSVKPGETYTYTVVARIGPAGALTDGPKLSLTVTTESVETGVHAIFFNRGAVASQEYARRFLNQRPDEVGPAAFNWLSRGLVEGLEAFIERAGGGAELFGAFFEFKNVRIFDALKAARTRGATIDILYDGDSQREGNEEALEGSGLEADTHARERSGRYAHNKFLILAEGGAAKAVWTGSTNLSQNGIYGHSNNAHVVRDPAVASAFLEYWRILKADQTRMPTATAVAALGVIPPGEWEDGMLPVFSPQPTLAALEWYAQIAAGADRALFMTFAFGMNERFVRVYDQTDEVLRFALMEKKGTGKNYKKQAEEVDRIRRRPNTVISVGAKVELNNFDRWLEEIDRTSDEQHVLYVHTKYMLVDPLGQTPIVVVGSANFSAASVDTNDENMIVIRGDATVADVYLGEFMRLFSHYAFRESLKFKGAASPAAALRRKYLRETPDWIDGEGPSSSYFAAGTDRTLRRLYFSGQ